MAAQLVVQPVPPGPIIINHPCGDLIDRGTRKQYLHIVVPLYRASIEGNWEAARDILQGRHHKYVIYSISENKETPLHVAAEMGHSTEFVRKLVAKMEEVDLQLQNIDGNTAFCLAAISGNVGMARIMVERNHTLPTICNSKNMMPIYLAAFHGNKEMVTFLYDKTVAGGWENDSKHAILLKCIEAGIFDVALRILKDNKELPQDTHVWDVLQVLARKPEVFDHVGRWPIISQITSSLVIGSAKESKATLLLRVLWIRIMGRSKDVIDNILRGPMIEKDGMETYPSQILFIAAKMNNTPFLVELIREYPDLIWKKNDDGQTIFHVAVSHRHHNIYRLLHEIGSIKDLITPITDKQGNNILHLVANNPLKNALGDWVAAPFQTRSEFLWYKEVENIVPPSCREVKNTAGQTPQELFMENHEDLVFKGVNWINSTINQSMVVAALVCTVGFSVVFSIPGGFQQDNGLPIFIQDRHFMAFIVITAISFILSTSSILIFLSIVLSRHQRTMELLLQKWVIGQLALLTSIVAIVAAFSVSFFILYRKSTVPYIIYATALILLCLYVTAYLSLYRDAITAIFSPRRLFKPKHVLYRKTKSFKLMFLFWIRNSI